MTTLQRVIVAFLILLIVSPASAQSSLSRLTPFGLPTDVLAAGEPSLAASLNQATYGPGQRLALGVKVQSPGGGPVVDFFAGIVLPDGTTAVSVRLGAPPVIGSLGNLRSLQPVAARISLAGSFAVDQPLFEYTFTGGEPLGDYLVYFAAVRTGALADGVIGAGELLALHTQTFRFTTAPSIATVEIQQTGLLLTAIGATRQLSATAKDAYGNPLDPQIMWRSTRPAQIAVDNTGLVRADTANGSSQIIAEAGGVSSAPLLVVVTPVAPDAILITDAQIVGAPVETDPAAPPSFDNTYKVTLSGVVAPPIGALLVNTESQPVAGRVVAIEPAGSDVIATLALVPLPDLFPNLVVEEVIDIANAPVNVAPEIGAAYDVTRTGNTFTFTPKVPAAANSPLATPSTAVDTRALPPFTSCKAEITGFPEGGTLPVQLSAPPLFSLTVNPTLDVKYTPAAGLERFVVRAEPTAKVEGGITLTAAFEGKITCEVELFVFRVPVGGPLSLVIGGLVPVGVRLEAGGKFTVATLGLGTKVEASAKAAIGVACPGGACGFVRQLDQFTLKTTPTVDAPSISDVRLEPSLAMFGFVEAEIGNPFLKSIRFEAFKAKVGGKLQGSFALPASQLADASYRSDYKVSLEASASVGADLDGVLKLLGLSSLTAVELTVSTELAKSPAPAATAPVTGDRASFTVGDTVNFKIKLDPQTVNFFPGLGPYNVKQVLLVRGQGNAQVVGRTVATDGQTEFTIPFTATGPGTVQDFSAFVVTTLVPFDVFALEIGVAAAAAGGSTALTISTLAADPTIIKAVIGQGPTALTITRPIGDTAEFLSEVQQALAGFATLDTVSVNFEIPVSLNIDLSRFNTQPSIGHFGAGAGCGAGAVAGSNVTVSIGEVGGLFGVGACGSGTTVSVRAGNISGAGFSTLSAQDGATTTVTAGLTEKLIVAGCRDGIVNGSFSGVADVEVKTNTNCRATITAPVGGSALSQLEIDFNVNSSIDVTRAGNLAQLLIRQNDRGKVKVNADTVSHSLFVTFNTDLRLDGFAVGAVPNTLLIQGNSNLQGTMTVGDVGNLGIRSNNGSTLMFNGGDVVGADIDRNTGLVLSTLNFGDVSGVLFITNNRGFSDAEAHAFADARQVGEKRIGGNLP